MKKFNASEEETLVIIGPLTLIGAAFLVKNKKESKEYIAKKIMLGTLNDKE